MALISRRDALVGGATALALPSFGATAKRGLRVAHLTDFHCQPELGAAEGSARAVRHAMGQRPDLVLVGGDLVMDATAVSAERARLQWDLYRAAIAGTGRTPTYHCLGNHDPWGWSRKASGTTGEEPLWGKRWFLKEFGQERTYHSFDQGAWHFAIVDVVDPVGEGYRGFLDDEQMAWLRSDLAATRKPTLILSHIPIFSITPAAMAFNAKDRAWEFGNSLMTENSEAIRALFAQNRHVKIALSGHTHLLDRVDYDGVSYLCGGAVCGKWWQGPNGPFAPGYRMLNLHDDGTFAERYVEWGWASPPEPRLSLPVVTRTMANTVVGLFDDASDAHGAVQDLMAAGYAKDRISLVAADPNGEYQKYGVDAEGNLAGEGASTGLVSGTVVGGLLGLLIGVGLIFAPVGGLLVAGPFAGLVAGAAAGAATGGVLGGLIGLGIPKEHAELYAEGVRRGGTLVNITVDESETQRVRDLLDRDGAVDIEQRGGYYRSQGFTGYDPSNHPFSDDQRASERDMLKAYASDETLSTGVGPAASGGRIKTYAYADTPTGVPVNPPDDSNGKA